MSDWSDRVFVLDYDSAVALRYHGRRQAFLDFLARLDPAVTIVFGATAFSAVLSGRPIVTAAAALATTMTSALNLAFGFHDRSRLHETLFRKWGALRAELPTLDAEDEVALRRLEVRRAEIDAESPAQMLALSTMCENEEKTVRRAEPLYRVGWLQRTLANLFTLPGWQPVPEAGARS